MKHSDIVAKIKKNAGRKYNSIPSGLKRGRKIVPGIVKKEIIGVTSALKVGKTKFVIQHFVKNPLQFVRAVNDESKLDIHIFVVCLQKSELAYRAMVIENLLFERHGIQVGLRDIMSILGEEDRKVDDRIIKMIEDQADFFEYFDKKVTIITTNKPSEIHKIIETWYRGKGSVIKIGTDTQGNDAKEWRYDNENLFPVLIIDQLTRLGTDFDPVTRNALDTRGSMGVMMNHCLEYAARFDFCVIPVHPQVPDKDRVEMDYTGKTKQEKVEPSLDGLAVNRQIGDYYTTLLALFTPRVYKIKQHAGFNVNTLKEKYVSLSVLASEYGKRNDRIGLWFEGAGGYFEELPRAPQKEDDEPIDYEELIAKMKAKIKR